jgi:hypothetical protein
MHRLARWIGRGFAAIGVLVVLALAVIVIGNPLSSGSGDSAIGKVTTPVKKVVPGDDDEVDGKAASDEQTPSEYFSYQEDFRSQAEQEEAVEKARDQYADYQGQQRGDRTAQADLDKPVLQEIVKVRSQLDRCGRDHADYGVFNFSTCDQLPLPDGISIKVTEDSYTISGSAGAATFLDRYQLATFSHGLTCDQPGVGACSAQGTWKLY